MPQKPYSQELKLLIIELYNKGFSASELAKDYDIKSGPQLIKLWVSMYNQSIKNAGNKLSCKGDYILKKDVSNKVLIDKIEELQKQLKKKDEEFLKLQIEKEFMEKCMPSCMNYSRQQVMMIQATREYKYKAFCLIYEIEFRKVLSIAKMCKIAKVSRGKYQKFKKDNLLLNNISKNDYKFNSSTLPIFQSKIKHDVIQLINDFFEENKISSGAKNIKLWIKSVFNIKVSVKTILKIMKDNEFKFQSPYRFKRSKILGRDLMEKTIRADLIENNFSANNCGEKIGIDGTIFKLLIDGKKVELLCEIAYDFYSRKVIGWKFGTSENAQIVLDVIKQVHKYCLKNSFNDAIIQSDRGRANASIIVKNFEEKQNNFIMSMSKAGFKHNAPTESMNGWIKTIFFKTCGIEFDSIENFENEFSKFVFAKNNLQNLRY
ncbi:transposase [Spiroplasma alleghenense]|uniref:Transposase n=1 Tax=Spiroplasma alleghenense TaxID=216931 RepID=A0A345Z4Z6_9MOLU|nr:transposase [Spiroplasma alleghenense]AXK51675.1 hypothetical protein SALLE_v1c10050 [Spiroplasma alleghenense]